MRTVGVAPGSYTLQFGAPPMMAPNPWQMVPPTRACPPDEISSGAYGVPTWNWYGYTVPGAIGPGQVTQGPPSTQTAAPLYNPYGTESELRGFHDGHRKRRTLSGLGFRGMFGAAGNAAALVSSSAPISQLHPRVVTPTSGPGNWWTQVTGGTPGSGGSSFPIPGQGEGGVPMATVTAESPWYMQPYVLIPALLLLGWFGWKKLHHQSASAAPASP